MRMVSLDSYRSLSEEETQVEQDPLSELLPVFPWELYLWQLLFQVIKHTLYWLTCVVSQDVNALIFGHNFKEKEPYFYKKSICLR